MTNNRYIHNVETDEIIIEPAVFEPLTEKEQKDLDAQTAKNAELEALKLVEDEAKATAKAALLAQLGITEEQAKLLLS
jgi:hypothetical protein